MVHLEAHLRLKSGKQTEAGDEMLRVKYDVQKIGGNYNAEKEEVARAKKVAQRVNGEIEARKVNAADNGKGEVGRDC